MTKEAWVTVVTNDTYGLGALVLGCSLRRVGTTRDTVVMVTPGVSDRMREELGRVFTSVIHVDVMDSGDSANLALMARPELGVTFTKLHAWTLVQYSKCVFLDADTLVIQNADELFEREELSAAPDPGWPDCFNSGVFVFVPSSDTYQALLDFAVAHGSFDGADQGLLNMFFKDWATQDIRKHLPFIYNLVASASYTYLPAFKHYGGQVKIVHFLGSQKPWTRQGEASAGPLQRAWWSVFREDVSNHLSQEMNGVAGALARGDDEGWRKEAWEAGDIDYLGHDSFDNIWRRICETVGIAQGAGQTTAPKDQPVETISKSVEQQVTAQPVGAKVPSTPVPAPEAPPSAETIPQSPISVESVPQPPEPQPLPPPFASVGPVPQPPAPVEPIHPPPAPVEPVPPPPVPVEPVPQPPAPVEPVPPPPVPVEPVPKPPVPVEPVPQLTTPVEPVPQPPTPVEPIPQPPAPIEPVPKPPTPVEPVPQPPAPIEPVSQLPAPLEPVPQIDAPKVAPQPATPVTVTPLPTVPTETTPPLSASSETTTQVAAPSPAVLPQAPTSTEPAVPVTQTSVPLTQPAKPVPQPIVSGELVPKPAATVPQKPITPEMPIAVEPISLPPVPTPELPRESPPQPPVSLDSTVGLPQDVLEKPVVMPEATKEPAVCGIKPEECCGKPQECSKTEEGKLAKAEPVCQKPQKKPKEVPKLPLASSEPQGEQISSTGSTGQSAEAPKKPETPTITPPSAPLSPVVAEDPEVCKLQATQPQPSTPPAGGSDVAEPPVPPKRKQGKNGKPAPKGGKK